MHMRSECHRNNIVLLFVRLLHRAQREKTSGVYAAAIRRGWQIQPIEAVASPARTRQEIAMWHPMGSIVDQLAIPENARLGKNAFCGVPTVIMGSDSHRRTQVFDRSVQDGRSVVSAAVEELASARPEAFAFVGDPGGPSWSVERGALFKDAVSGMGRFSRYCGPSPRTSHGRARLAKWLKMLARPCGVMLAADHLALPLYMAAADAGLSVPGDLVVVGVDNDEELCGNINPPLSSVQLDFFRAGENAIDLLERRLAHPNAPPMTEIYRATGVVQRLSTMKPQRNSRVSAALSFIAIHATKDITVSDVVLRMGCCRRLAERMFRESCGKTILDAIHETRFEKAFMLLRNSSFPIDAIPHACGMASASFFKTLFKRHTGMTMREWRKTALGGQCAVRRRA